MKVVMETERGLCFAGEDVTVATIATIHAIPKSHVLGVLRRHGRQDCKTREEETAGSTTVATTKHTNIRPPEHTEGQANICGCVNRIIPKHFKDEKKLV